MYVLLFLYFFIYYDYDNYIVTLVKLLHGARWIITPVSESWRPPWLNFLRRVCWTSKCYLSSTSLTKLITLIAINLVTPRPGAKWVFDQQNRPIGFLISSPWLLLSLMERPLYFDLVVLGDMVFNFFNWCSFWLKG
jgi:hypothetical protein